MSNGFGLESEFDSMQCEKYCIVQCIRLVRSLNWNRDLAMYIGPNNIKLPICFAGVYQSHWRLSHHGLYFGHRVWCHIIVDEKEVLEHSDQEKESVLTVQREDYEEVKGNEVCALIQISVLHA